MIELIYDRDCPNVGACREVLRAALVEAGMPPSWLEWDRSAPETPTPYRSFGSPTIIVNGRDVSAVQGGAEPAGNSCRVYVDDVSGDLRRTPSVRSIVNALSAQNGAVPASGISNGER